MKRQVHQSGKPSGLHLRHPGHRSGIEHAVAHDAQAPGPLGDEDGAVRKKRHTPRLVQPFGHNEANLMLNAGIEHDRPVGERRRRPGDRRRRGPHGGCSGLSRGSTDEQDERKGRMTGFHAGSDLSAQYMSNGGVLAVWCGGYT